MSLVPTAINQCLPVPGPPLGGYPPAQWTEVFSRADGRWIPVDPVRGIVNEPKRFEPPPHDKRNRMVYVLAFEEDGWARDVTQRYGLTLQGYWLLCGRSS